MNLRGVSFDWQDPEMEGRQIGFIAQETMDVIPEVVSGTEQMNYSMQYGPITAVLVEAVKEQQTHINEQQAHIEELEKEKGELKHRLERLEEMILNE